MRWALPTGTTTPGSCAPDRPVERPADRTSVRSLGTAPRSTASPAAAGWLGRCRRAALEGDAGSGCGAPPVRRRDRSRTPRTSRASRDRDTRCTTAPNGGSAGRRATSGRTRRVRGSDGSSRESGAALGASVLEHGPTGTGAHPSTKSVLLGTAVGVGLECTLHVVLLDHLAGRSARPTRSRCNSLDATRLMQLGAWHRRATRPGKATAANPPAATRARNPIPGRFGLVSDPRCDRARLLRLHHAAPVVHTCGQPCGMRGQGRCGGSRGE